MEYGGWEHTGGHHSHILDQYLVLGSPDGGGVARGIVIRQWQVGHHLHLPHATEPRQGVEPQLLQVFEAEVPPRLVDYLAGHKLYSALPGKACPPVWFIHLVIAALVVD